MAQYTAQTGVGWICQVCHGPLELDPLTMIKHCPACRHKETKEICPKCKMELVSYPFETEKKCPHCFGGVMKPRRVAFEVVVEFRPQHERLEEHVQAMLEMTQIRSGRTLEFKIESVKMKEIA